MFLGQNFFFLKFKCPTFKDVIIGKFNIVFASPESILENYRDILKNQTFASKVVGVAVDESHCIQEW